MSDVTYSINISASRGFFSHAVAATGATTTMGVVGMMTQTLVPGTSVATTTAINTATVSSSGLFYARNLSTVTTAAVSIGKLVDGVFVPCLQFAGGQAGCGRLSPGNYACQSNYANTRFLISIFEGQTLPS